MSSFASSCRCHVVYHRASRLRIFYVWAIALCLFRGPLTALAPEFGDQSGSTSGMAFLVGRAPDSRQASRNLQRHAGEESDVLAKLKGDLASLRLRATAYHILQPLNPVGRLSAEKFKAQIEKEVEAGAFVLDSVKSIAKEYSIDAASGLKDGLLDELFAPGAFQEGSEAWEAKKIRLSLEPQIFDAPIGKILGPLETPHGYSLLLITERVGCAKDDPERTKLVKFPDGRGRLGPSDGEPGENAGEIDFAVILSTFLLVVLFLITIWANLQ
mmetsp:Transcript_40665/g.73252  ORF Transcript_40665/g.73252 Transcript_40665/m.73252 type:complete len:271 (+) Transcript_40665:22-834(+)